MGTAVPIEGNDSAWFGNGAEAVRAIELRQQGEALVNAISRLS